MIYLFPCVAPPHHLTEDEKDEWIRQKVKAEDEGRKQEEERIKKMQKVANLVRISGLATKQWVEK